MRGKQISSALQFVRLHRSLFLVATMLRHIMFRTVCYLPATLDISQILTILKYGTCYDILSLQN
jgi:hypothetical protein